ncbi:unnamed protein product, partial [Brenthis ino]
MKLGKRLFNRKKRKFILFVILAIFGLSLLKSKFAPEFSLKKPNISCHYEKTVSYLRILQNNSTLPSKSIFFHDTSCSGNLTARQSCAIESATRAHPDWQINVIYSSPISYNIKGVSQLKRFKNVKFWRLHIDDFSIGTPLENLVKSDLLKNCRYGVERTLDVLKYLTLYKWGGIFIDLDMIVGRPLGSLARNWAAREDNEVIAEAILAFSRDSVGRIISENAVRHIQSNYKNSDWCSSPNTMTKVLQNSCSTSEATYMSSATCNGFEVYGQQFFYPLPKEKAHEYFMRRELGIHNAYTYYLWGQDTKKYKLVRDSPYSKLARHYCPMTYQLFEHYLGLY